MEGIRVEDDKYHSVQTRSRVHLYKMQKTRDLFKNISDTKGTFHAKMCPKKDRNGIYLTEAEDIKNRWQETQTNYTKKSS